jgi:hypothetical protein
VPHEVEESALVEDAFQDDLKLGDVRRRIALTVIVRQGLNHSRPAPSVPMRACTPSDTTSAALKAKSAGICAW